MRERGVLAMAPTYGRRRRLTPARSPGSPARSCVAPRAASSALAPCRLLRQVHPRELDARRDAELAEDVAQVEVDRARAQEELPGDVAIRPALGDELRDV